MKKSTIANELLSEAEMKALLLYIKAGLKNMADCMVEAGWSESSAVTTGTKLLKTKKAKDFIEKRIAHALRKYRWEADDVLSEMALIASSDIGNYFIQTSDGLSVNNLLEMGPERRAIKKIKCIRTITGEGENKKVEDRIELELWSKDKMLELLGRYHDIFGESDKGDQSKIPMALVYVPDDGRNKSGSD